MGVVSPRHTYGKVFRPPGAPAGTWHHTPWWHCVWHDPYERINFWSHALPGAVLLLLGLAAHAGVARGGDALAVFCCCAATTHLLSALTHVWPDDHLLEKADHIGIVALIVGTPLTQLMALDPGHDRTTLLVASAALLGAAFLPPAPRTAGFIGIGAVMVWTLQHIVDGPLVVQCLLYVAGGLAFVRNGGHDRWLGLQDHHLLHYKVTLACAIHVAAIMARASLVRSPATAPQQPPCDVPQAACAPPLPATRAAAAAPRPLAPGRSPVRHSARRRDRAPARPAAAAAATAAAAAASRRCCRPAAGAAGAMTTLRRFTCNDLFTFNNVNLDILTETYNLPFYLQYLARWPEYCVLAEGPGAQAMAYILGKAEGEGRLWHGHVTAVTVAPEFRRQGLAARLMGLLEEITHKVHDAWFVDLFVRVSNAVAIAMYRGFGYSVYRTVLSYYGGGEDAYDMRKAMPRDAARESVRPLPRPVRPEELEFD
ncbi:NAA20 [Scenedesmus sp. PABB004]|nr:NAA20 [Scenedesmus sp. PABB004]